MGEKPDTDLSHWTQLRGGQYFPSGQLVPDDIEAEQKYKIKQPQAYSQGYNNSVCVGQGPADLPPEGWMRVYF